MRYEASKRRVFLLLVAVLASCDAGDSSSSTSTMGGGGKSGAGGSQSGCSLELCGPYQCNTFGSCKTTCKSSDDCIEGYVCDGVLCIGTECTESTAKEICGGYACVKGKCSPDCALGPCAEGFYCRGDTNECVPKCTSRGDPLCEGNLCDLGTGECESYCFDGELACAAGYLCTQANTCVPDTSAPPCSGGCGVYICVEALGHCATHCVEDGDCVAPAVCVNASCQ